MTTVLNIRNSLIQADMYVYARTLSTYIDYAELICLRCLLMYLEDLCDIC
jgi:hypothetical protein